MWDVRYHIALTAVCALMTLIDFTLSNARRFNSSMGNRTPWQWEGYTGHERRREIKIKILLQEHFVPLLRSKIVHNNTGVFKWAYVIFFTQFIFFVASGRHRTYLNISSGQISTPKFGLKKYPANFNWEWYLIAPEGRQIRIKFESFELEQSEHCQNDYLEIREAYSQHPTLAILGIEGVFGAVLARPMCGTDSPKEIHSAGNMVWVHFNSDSNATTTYKGFNATFTSSKYSPTMLYDVENR